MTKRQDEAAEKAADAAEARATKAAAEAATEAAARRAEAEAAEKGALLTPSEAAVASRPGDPGDPRVGRPAGVSDAEAVAAAKAEAEDVKGAPLTAAEAADVEADVLERRRAAGVSGLKALQPVERPVLPGPLPRKLEGDPTVEQRILHEIALQREFLVDGTWEPAVVEVGVDTFAKLLKQLQGREREYGLVIPRIVPKAGVAEAGLYPPTGPRAGETQDEYAVRVARGEQDLYSVAPAEVRVVVNPDPALVDGTIRLLA